MLLGDYSNIPIDGEVLKYVSQNYFNGKPITQEQATKPFEKYNGRSYLVFKFERIARKFNYIDK